MIAMLGKAFPQCVGGSKLAAAIEGTVARPSEAEVQVAAADEPATDAIAKRTKKRRVARTSDLMPDEPEGDAVSYDNEETAEQAGSVPKLPGTTFATVTVDQADLARVSGEVADPDAAPASQQVASAAPVEAGMPSALPFKVKTPSEASDWLGRRGVGRIDMEYPDRGLSVEKGGPGCAL